MSRYRIREDPRIHREALLPLRVPKGTLEIEKVK